MKALVGAFNQEKALVGALSVIVKSPGTFGSRSFQAVVPVLPDAVAHVLPLGLVAVAAHAALPTLVPAPLHGMDIVVVHTGEQTIMSN